MATVTIEGSAKRPNTYLRPGERRYNVERTGLVNKMIRNGYVEVVTDDEPVEKVIAQAAERRHENLVVPNRRLLNPPSESGLKAEWKQFLDDLEIAYPSNATKADMIARYKAVLAAQNADDPSPPLGDPLPEAAAGETEAESEYDEALGELSPGAQEFVEDAGTDG